MKLDTLHCALLVAIVLLAVYGFGSGEFREGAVPGQVAPPHKPQLPCEDYPPSECGSEWQMNNRCVRVMDECMPSAKVKQVIKKVGDAWGHHVHATAI